MKKVLFIDRDGTLIKEPPVDFQVDSLEKLEFFPGVFSGLGKIVKELDYELVMVTNQDGLGTDSFPEELFWPAHEKMMQALVNEGILFKEVLIDRSLEVDQKPTRKPGTGVLNAYLYGGYDLPNSFVIGDRKTDIELAKNLGTQGVYLGNETGIDAVLCTQSWEEIYQFLKQKPRVASRTRKTNETDISIWLNLDGSGKSTIYTGIGFFDHMLEQVAKHGGLDPNIPVKGDLEIDEHHIIEDVA